MDVITRGSRKSDLEITITDAAAEADFSTVSAADVRVIGEMNGVVIFDSPVGQYVPAVDGNSAVCRRAWDAGDTDQVGRLWVVIKVLWGSGMPQYFPTDGPLRLDIVRAPGDA